MGRIDDSLAALQETADTTERALQLAGLLSTLFKIKGVALIVTGRLAFDSYANSTSDKPELELATYGGKLTPRIVLEVMRGQLRAKGLVSHWTVSGIPIQFLGETTIIHRELCRDFNTDHGVVKLLPAEEITAERILASVYPEPDVEAHTQARLLLINGLTNAFSMDWTVLHNLCHRPEYRVGEELSQMRLAAKKDVDLIGGEIDEIGQPNPPAQFGAATALIHAAEAEQSAAPASAPTTTSPLVKPKPLDEIVPGYPGLF